jgi:thiosulfate/3-mercaptopyruvate sulfurtransferase
MLHGCTVGDGSLIGIGAIVLNGARIVRVHDVAATVDALKVWKAAGLPMSIEPVSPSPAIFPMPAETASLMVTKEEMVAALDSEVVLLDVRDVDEWIGESSSPYGKDFAPRKGRIPGAKWIEWYRFMKPSSEGQVFKSPEEILADCRSAGISPKDPVYLYCFKGARASNTFVALKEAGIKDVRIYFGSWNEWSRDPGLPIDEGAPSMMPSTAKSAAA